MKTSKGQITLFVIIGLVLLLGTMTFLFMKNDSVEKNMDSQLKTQLSPNTDVATIQKVILSCEDIALHNATKQAVDTSFFFPYSSSLNFKGVPYFYFSGRGLLPEGFVVERKMADIINSQVLDCVNNFDDVKQILSGDMSFNGVFKDVKVTMDVSSVNVMIDPAITLSTPEKAITVGPVTNSIDSDLGALFRTAELTIFSPEKDPSKYFEPAKDFAKDNGIEYSFSYFTFPTEGLWFVIKSDKKDSLYNTSSQISFRIQAGGSV